MYLVEREEKILQFLEKNGLTSTKMLAEAVGTSLATIRRDINRLSEFGLVDKMHGAVRLCQKEKQHFMGTDIQAREEDEEKRHIAAVAAKLVQDDDTIFIGAGRTCTYLAHFIKDKKNLTIVTTNVNAVMELYGAHNLSIMLLGGDIHFGDGFTETLDVYTVEQLKKVYINKVFLTVNGIELVNGYSVNSQLQIPLYKHLMKNAKKFYVLANSDKFDKCAFALFCGIQQIRYVVTSDCIDAKYLDYYRENDITVYMREEDVTKKLIHSTAD